MSKKVVKFIESMSSPINYDWLWLPRTQPNKWHSKSYLVPAVLVWLVVMWDEALEQYISRWIGVPASVRVGIDYRHLNKNYLAIHCHRYWLQSISHIIILFFIKIVLFNSITNSTKLYFLSG